MEAVFGIICVLVVLFLWYRNPKSFRLDKTDDVPSEIEIRGNKLTCKHCDHALFYPGRAQLNTAMASFFGIDWANREAAFLSCEYCGFIHWFKRRPEEIEQWKVRPGQQRENSNLSNQKIMAD